MYAVRYSIDYSVTTHMPMRLCVQLYIVTNLDDARVFRSKTLNDLVKVGQQILVFDKHLRWLATCSDQFK